MVTVALPRMGRDLPAQYVGVLEGQSYVYAAYLLTLSALLILAGALNDHYGRRRMFAVGLVSFGATSVLCGLAPTMETPGILHIRVNGEVMTKPVQIIGIRPLERAQTGDFAAR